MFKGYKIVTENGFQHFYNVRTGLKDFKIDLDLFTVRFIDGGTSFDSQTLFSISSYVKTLQKIG
jgi:hypothetical protein